MSIGNVWLDCELGDLTPFGIEMRGHVAKMLGFVGLARTGPTQWAYRLRDGKFEFVKLSKIDTRKQLGKSGGAEAAK